ncbi:MAG: site-specific integrase [Comamonadaceae bacterium]|nr:MAG: site-specific integrase [Comamonadaceae bacterium]
MTTGNASAPVCCCPRSTDMGNSSKGKAPDVLKSLTAASQAPATRLAYANDLKHFKAHGGRIPATVEQVTAYLAAHYGTLAVATLERRMCAIHWAHQQKGLASPVHDPVVKATLSGIRRTQGSAQRRVKAMVKDDLLQLLVRIDQEAPVKAARDRALLLVGFAGAFRRSELVALTVADLTKCGQGIELLIQRSKTDQEGQGRTVFIPKARGAQCPVKALDAWLEVSGIAEGPIFRSVTRSGSIGSRALTPQSVALVIKESMRRLHGDVAAANVSGHSLRAGYCTQAAESGLQPFQIRQQTGHTSNAMLDRYIRPVDRRATPSLL